MRRAGLMVFLLAGCDGGLEDEEVAAAVQQAFDAANPPGRTGLLMKGRSGVVWWEAGMFEKSCLEQKDLAFNDDPASRPASAKGRARISPTYDNQWGITAVTDTGYCIDLGADPQLQIGEVVWSADRYRVDTTITMKTATPWFSCLERAARQRVVEVTVDNDLPVVQTDLSLFQGDCPVPVPASQARKPRREPTRDAPIAPTASDIRKLAAAFDAALDDHNAEAARALVSCYNLFEEEPYGACSLAEIIPHGSVKGGDADPWLEYAATDFEGFGRPIKDRDNGSIYHVPFTHKRTGKRKSLSVQWVDGQWKLLGVVSVKSAGLTRARIVNDLHDRSKRDIFSRRLAGEQIDEKGEPLSPGAGEQ